MIKDRLCLLSEPALANFEDSVTVHCFHLNNSFQFLQIFNNSKSGMAAAQKDVAQWDTVCG